MQQQKLFSKIFNQAGNETETTSFLASVINEHPYFGLAHFYTLKNTDPLAQQYYETAAKTNLFFNSSFFLNAQLLVKDRSEEFSTEKISALEEIHKNIVINFEDDVAVSTQKDLPAKLETIQEETHQQNVENTSTEIISADENNLPPTLNPLPVNEPQLIFAPLHASDYFASQGIKLSEDAMANDKLGKQLKSFTAWLKTMKKVHPDKLPAATAVSETAVQTQAEKSNVEEDIVTEPMAEAYVQQNKYSKAVEIYSKLSLLNPAKSAYFATKIDSLKK